MFVLNEILVFSPGRRQEALDRLAWIHGLMAAQPGFREAIVARYLGDPARHTIMRFWDDEDIFQTFRAGPDGNYGRGRPEGLYVNERVATPLIGLAETAGSAKGDVLVKVQRDLAAGAWEAFLAVQKKMLSLGEQLPGLVWARSLRARDEDVSIAVTRLRSREDAAAMLDSKPYGDLEQQQPEGVTTTRTEVFEIVSEVGPKR